MYCLQILFFPPKPTSVPHCWLHKELCRRAGCLLTMSDLLSLRKNTYIRIIWNIWNKYSLIWLQKVFKFGPNWNEFQVLYKIMTKEGYWWRRTPTLAACCGSDSMTQSRPKHTASSWPLSLLTALLRASWASFSDRPDISPCSVWYPCSNFCERKSDEANIICIHWFIG